jgi:microcystin degradation protein MlrC
MKRFAIGGWQHETNTFAPFETDYGAFEMADGWPALTEGPAIIETVAGINLPIAGFIESARHAAELVPTLWTSAEPAGYVTDDAFERILSRLCAGIAAAGPLDGVYLDLHGAMVTRQFEDAEGEILDRVRAVIGPDTPLVASLDFHANISERMVRVSDALTIYRTYPHVDNAETGARAAEILLKLASGARVFKAYRQSEYLIPLHLGATAFEPNRRLYARLKELEASGLTADMALGFPAGDVFDAGPCIVSYADSADRAQRIADGLYDELADAEGRYQSVIFQPDVAIARAMANHSDRPVILADAQDNSGAGSTSDSTSPVTDLIRHRAKGAVVAIITDAEFAAVAHASGVGGVFEGTLGGKIGNFGRPGAGSMRARFRVLALGDGKFVCTGPVWLGACMQLGAMALVEVLDADGAGVKVVVSSVRCQALDQAMLRHVGIEPSRQRIIVLKSTVHFRADFDPLAAETMVVEWPGQNFLDPSRYDYKRLRPQLRVVPNGPSLQVHRKAHGR